MAGVPDMRRNDGNIHNRNTNFSPFPSEKQTNLRTLPRNTLSSRPDFNGGYVGSVYIPLNSLKSADNQSLVHNEKSGSHKYYSIIGEEELGRERSNLIKMQERGDRKQQPHPQKTLPNISSVKYVHTNCISTELPYWKSVDKEEPPVRTLFRAKKWVNSDERGCKRVSCLPECERIGSKYCSCSSRKIGVTLVQRNNVSRSTQDGVCSCFNQKKLENQKKILGRRIVEVTQSNKSCFLKTDIGKGQIDYFSNQNESYFLDPKRNRYCGCGSDMKAVRVATVQSSKCFYLKRSGGYSYITSKNRLMFQNSAYVIPNVVNTHPPDADYNFLGLNGEKKPALRETLAWGPHAQSDNFEHFGIKRYKPINTQEVSEQSNVMGHQFTKLGEPGLKLNPQELRCEDTLKCNKAVKLENNIAYEEEKEPKKVLDVLEVDILAEANNILEKIACTLDQIKVLSQSTLPQDTLQCYNKMAGEEFSRGDSVDEKMKELSGMDNSRLIDRGKEQKKSVNISSENESMQLNQDEEMEVEHPTAEETFIDKNRESEENENPMETCPLNDPDCDDINAIPLKITKAVSAFKTVETNAAYSCKMYRTQELKGGQEAKKSHSINLISQTEVGGKSKAVELPSKIIPEEILHDHNTLKETGKDLSSSPNKTNLLEETDPLVSSALPKVKNLGNSPNEGIDHKKMTSVALQSVLETAISSKPLPIKDILEPSMMGDQGKAEAMKINTATNRVQPSSPSRLSALSQPKASYIKALKREFQNFLDKPMIERLNRLMEPAQKLQSPCLSNSKPPVYPSRNPLPKKNGTPLRKKSADGANKRNASIDDSLKKTQLRPQTSPNKARGEVVSRQGSSVTPVESSLKKPYAEKYLRGAESTRPSTVSNAHKGQTRVSFRSPSRSANQEKELSQSEDVTKACMLSPLVLEDKGEPTKMNRNQQTSLPARLGQTASEEIAPLSNLGNGDEHMRRRKKSFTENVASWKTEIRDSEPSSPHILTSVGGSGEAGSPRSHFEVPYLKQVGRLPCMENGGPVEEPCGNRENIMLPPEEPQYQIVHHEEPQASFEEVQVPIIVKTITCDCCGRDDSSDASRAFSHSSQSETRTVSSVPTLAICDSYRETDICAGCRRSLGVMPNLRLRKGKPLLRMLKDTTLGDPGEQLNHLPRPKEGYGEEGLRLAQPLDGIPSLGSIKDWLRDSNADVRRWSSELTFKVDVGTSVSGFHVAMPPIGGVRGHRDGCGTICTTDAKAARKDVACSTKRSSIMVILNKKCKVVDGTPSHRHVPKKMKESNLSSVVSSRTLARAPKIHQRNMLIIIIVCVCLYTFLGWVVLLPTYYI